jgi:DeoR/GlpR family transcriptional regulator of sugar metabolism
VTRHLFGKRDVQVVTNSTLVFAYGRLNPALQITMTGGEETWLVADSSKYGKSGFASVLPLSGLGGIITDDRLEARDLADASIRVRAV